MTGCLAQRYKEEIRKEIPEVDAILGTNSYEDIVNAITEALGGRFYENFETLEGLPKLTAKRSVTTGGHFAYLKIAEGCNKRCTYCIIPYIRGNYRSVPMEELVAQAKELVAAGAKELILVAQETTLYGVDLYGEKSLHKLLDALNEIPGLFWIRIMYCYPEEIYEELIDAIARNEESLSLPGSADPARQRYHAKADGQTHQQRGSCAHYHAFERADSGHHAPDDTYLRIPG